VTTRPGAARARCRIGRPPTAQVPRVSEPAQSPAYGLDANPLLQAAEAWSEADSDGIYRFEDGIFDAYHPFVSPPLALPLALVLGSVTAFQLVTAGGVLYTLAKLPRSWRLLLFAKAALTVVYWGQTMPLLSAALVAGVAGPAGLAGLLLAVGVAAKASPALLAVPLALGRRWVDLLVCGVALLALQAALWWHPVEGASWGAWLAFSRRLAEFVPVHHYNVAVPLPLAALVGLSLVDVLRRPYAFREKWLLTGAAWPCLLPLAWWHYGWISAAALMLLAGPRRASLAAFWCLPFFFEDPRWVYPTWVGWLWLFGTYVICRWLVAESHDELGWLLDRLRRFRGVEASAR